MRTAEQAVGLRNEGVAEFKPSPKLKRVYWLYYLWYLVPALVLCALISLFSVIVGVALTLLLVVAPTIIVGFWINRFYSTVVFRLEKDHAYARYGVWWVKEKRVPYNLVSEVKLRQGPLQRRYKLACVDLYTPATGMTKPELTFFQLDAETANRVAAEIRLRVGILTSRERRVIEEEILEELRRIRRLLEERLR